MAYLLDLNVVLALILETHVHHASATAWLREVSLAEQIHLCRTVQTGFFRLVSNRVVMGEAVLSGEETWRLWDQLLRDVRFSFRPEPSDLESHFRSLTKTFSHSPKRWQDGYLAAFALAERSNLVTFDQGFAGYPGLNWHLLR